nr:unnamed protein product [Callosobruchus analis]
MAYYLINTATLLWTTALLWITSGNDTDKEVSHGLANGGNGGTPISRVPFHQVVSDQHQHNMSWHDHVATIAKTASQKLGVLFRCRKLYTPEQLLLLYKAQI